MNKTSLIKNPRVRGWVAGIIALACIQAWLTATTRARCVDVISMVFSALEFEIIIPTVGLCVALAISATVIISSMRLLR